MKCNQKLIFLISDTDESCGNLPLIHSVHISPLEAKRSLIDADKLPDNKDHLKDNLRLVFGSSVFNT